LALALHFIFSCITFLLAGAQKLALDSILSRALFYFAQLLYFSLGVLSNKCDSALCSEFICDGNWKNTSLCIISWASVAFFYLASYLSALMRKVGLFVCLICFFA